MDGRTEWTDGQNGRTEARTTPKLYPSDFVGDKKVGICEGVPSTAALVFFYLFFFYCVLFAVLTSVFS